MIVNFYVRDVLSIAFARGARVAGALGKGFLRRNGLFQAWEADQDRRGEFTYVGARQIGIFRANCNRTIIVHVASGFGFCFFPSFREFFGRCLQDGDGNTFDRFCGANFVKAGAASRAARDMNQARRSEVASEANDDRNVFRILRDPTREDLRQGLVRFLRGRITIFYVRGSFSEDAGSFRAVFLRSAIPVRFYATIRNHLSSGNRRGTIQSFLFSGFDGRVYYCQRRVCFVNGAFKDLGDNSVEVRRRKASALLARDLRDL